MRLYQQILTENDCCKLARPMLPQGVMVHSTGADNPRISRYVGPDDGRLGRPSSRNWNRGDVDACVHAFIGKLADGSVASYQTLPWNIRGWHCGGRANGTHIGFEICEDGLDDPVYFKKVYREAVELTAYLCGLFHLDPLGDGVVLCHAEGYRRGIATNHADVLHWFTRFGRDMDDFRRDTAALLRPPEQEPVEYEGWLACLERYRREMGEKPATMPGLLAEAEKLGLTDGSRPRDFATREECAVMARKAALRKE